MIDMIYDTVRYTVKVIHEYMCVPKSLLCVFDDSLCIQEVTHLWCTFGHSYYLESVTVDVYTSPADFNHTYERYKDYDCVQNHFNFKSLKTN